MSIEARTPDGVIHQFPDGTPPEVIDAAIKDYVQTKPVAERKPRTGVGGTSLDILEGLYLGARQPLDTAAMRLEQMFPSVNEFGAQLGMAPSAADILAEQNRLRAQSPAKTSQIVGNVAGVAPMLAAGGISAAPATFGEAALAGGASSALLSQAETPVGFAAETGTGAVLGPVAKLGGDIVGGVLAPRVSEGVRKLSNLGVRLTPGAILGAADTAVGQGLNTVESALTSIPGFGALISYARGMVPGDFEKAAVKELADFVGLKPPAKLSGDQAVSWVKKGISGKFNELVPKLKMTMPGDWQDKVLDIYSGLNLPNNRKGLLDDFLSSVSQNIEGVIGKDGEIVGRNLQNALSDLSDTARTFMKSSDGFERRVGTGLAQVRSFMLDQLANQNKAQADEILKLNKAWNAQTVLDKAVGYAGNVVSPANLTRAVKSLGGGKIGGFYEDLARAGMELPKGLADSGTFTRAATAQALGLTGTGFGANYLAQSETDLPYTNEGLASLLALGAAYSPAGRNVLQKIMTREAGPAMTALAQAARTAVSPATASSVLNEPKVKVAQQFGDYGLVGSTTQEPAEWDAFGNYIGPR